MEEKKYRYEMTLRAEGRSTGFVRLTEAEARLIDSVLDIRNWEDPKLEAWSGDCTIDVNHPKQITT